MIKKGIRRIKWFIVSIPNIILSFIFERKRHPWKYIYDYLTKTAEKRYSKTNYYIKKYFTITKIQNGFCLERQNFKIIIPKLFFDKQNFMVSFLNVYFDIIYTNQNKYPIPCIVTEGDYEKYNTIIKSGDYVIDAGANIGEFSILASDKVGSKGKVFAFEPIPYIYQILTKQKEIVKDNNIVFIMEALDKTSGISSFNYSKDEIAGASMIENENSKNSIKVKVNSIDNYVKMNNIEKIDFIKMDIEGSERNALVGATNTIKKFKPKLSICIYHLTDDPIIIKNIITNIRQDYEYKMTKYKIYAW